MFYVENLELKLKSSFQVDNEKIFGCEIYYVLINYHKIDFLIYSLTNKNLICNIVYIRYT